MVSYLSDNIQTEQPKKSHVGNRYILKQIQHMHFDTPSPMAASISGGLSVLLILDKNDKPL